MVKAFSNRCGCCDETFDTRNGLFQHLRNENHTVVSDSGSEEDVDSVSTPGAQASSSKIKPKDLEWRDIGSVRYFLLFGMFGMFGFFGGRFDSQRLLRFCAHIEYIS